ncbi:urea carboxylase [Verminephrobacter eiseniae]|uniref:Urea amidolyase related protein n=2 Tax=Verminephrobacter eiseniae TaxID=364317 RepID=A1WPE7_VEREI|nr:urea carboxylase [Verminephrobacter eiseniae]ABM59504.1 urea amidolyase related protein [Verminephrobacter eiseniae EF01-2]MCW5285028.1 urea carboxylase [Verminephrobacter eiseniae]MCW5302735.1 urea carboxylase [Verminephrobacter eiseniae]
MPTPPGFDKVLIANRGAIACRIIRSLRSLGLGSVAVYSEADADSAHVAQADQALCIGPAAAARSYLDADRILAAARESGAGAIHPGYGFLSESPDFAEACEAAGLVFIGPTPAQMRAFGFKHQARALAQAHGVPLLPGTGLLADLAEAVAQARRIGYPVMLKSSAGGGGIGMRLVRDAGELAAAFEAVAHLARAHFNDAGLFLEKFVEPARHIEVQLFGDGQGRVVALGERDCSAQRRNQKVIEETPAPHLAAGTRAALIDAALRLGRAVNYRSAGTVEFVLDAASQQFYFLEVNTRLQVEHGVTEQVTGIDLVRAMVQLAQRACGDGFPMPLPTPRGAAIEVRLYAEDPARNFQPSAGLLTDVHFAPEARTETWVASGSQVSAHYDPLLAKLIVTGADRADAVRKLQAALAATRLAGIETNLRYLRALAASPMFCAGRIATGSLADFAYRPRAFEVLEPGLQTTVQDWPGRQGYWDVGVPPSGPMDDLGFRLANRLVGNDSAAAGLECTLKGPTLRFHHAAVVALCGAAMQCTLDGKPLDLWRAHSVAAGSVLALGAVQGGGGSRCYLALRGGIDVPAYLGSRATFTLGRFGGHAGRTLQVGDMLHIGAEPPGSIGAALPADAIARYAGPGQEWDIAVLCGPQGAPDFFTDADMRMLFDSAWEVHYHCSRTGVRLIGPRPVWARPDGGEAGLHPSNIHDNAYAIGAIDFTGDMPVILGPDGPSLGGFVCPAVVVAAERWKLGQLCPGDKVRLRCVAPEVAAALQAAQQRHIATLTAAAPVDRTPLTHPGTPILCARRAAADPCGMVMRQAGDCYLLVEWGGPQLDIMLRMRIHAMQMSLRDSAQDGIIDLTPGIRSLQIHFDPALVRREQLIDRLLAADQALGDTDDLVLASRTIHLPLCWDDSATRMAIAKYMQSVRTDAPWCPDNIEFIRRINGLQSIDEVRRVVFAASYLVLGLGDVYLGAPVATPVDPRHRLVTSKYNPARTWTPENAVGIGGAYMCIYGMEGPGGYQFVGRTLQMWNRWPDAGAGASGFEPGRPWLLRLFDQIRFYPVSEQELLQIRRDFPAGRHALRIQDGRFSMREYRAFLQDNGASIARFKSTQQRAFDAERERWHGPEQSGHSAAPEVCAAPQEHAGLPDAPAALPPEAHSVVSPLPGSVWKVAAKQGERVSAGDLLVVVESMKMEFAVCAPVAGHVWQIRCAEGTTVVAGQDLVVLIAARTDSATAR